MGQLLNDSVNQAGTAQLLNPEQQQFLKSLLSPTGEGQNWYQNTYVAPALQSYQQQILPAIQQRFVDADMGSSSALNQALAASAQDLTKSLAGQYGQAQLQGLQTRAVDPLIAQQEGILGPLIGSLGQLGSAAALAALL